MDGFKVRARAFPLHRKNRLDLGGKQQTKSSVESLDAVVERFNPETIPRQQKTLVLLAPQGEGEHATKAIEKVHAPLGEAAHQYFSIRTRTEGVARTRQLVPKLLEVVDLPIFNDPHLLAVFGHRLVPGRREVEDRQPTDPQRDGVTAPYAGVVRSPVALAT